MKQAMWVVVAVLVVAAVGGGAFYYGTKVGENRILQNPQRAFQQLAGAQGGQFPGRLQGQFPSDSGTPQAGGRNFQVAGGGLTGTVEQIDGNTVIITTDTEGTVRVQTSDTTLVEKYMMVGVADLIKGERIVVAGTQNDDGSYTARSIQSLRAIPVTGSDSTQGR
jgi:hypothetical protein